MYSQYKDNTMQDIDVYIKEMKEKQELDDFISKGLYPDRLKGKRTDIKYYPKLDDNIRFIRNINVNKYSLAENNFDKEKVMATIQRLESSLNSIIDKENENDNPINVLNNGCCSTTSTNATIENEYEKSCPICFENLGENNYLIPSCGHKLCMNCFVLNIVKNKDSGGNCSLCRKKIIPVIM